MQKILKMDRWSPYSVGIGIGLILALSFYFADHMLGTSLSFVKISAFVKHLFSKEYVENSTYYSRYLTGNAFFGFQQMLILFIFFGSWVASRLSGQRRVEHVPSIWKENFGPSKIKRYVGAFLGGVILMTGARIASGCTSGHCITGGSQMAISGWIFMFGMFISGIITAKILYRRAA